MVTQLVLAVGLLQATADNDPAPFSLAKPPAMVERLLAGEKLSKDDAAAAQKDCLRPYFPLLVMRDVGLGKGPAREVFAGYYLARHKDRRERWVKEGRFDLLADSMVVTARGDTDLTNQFAGEWAVILPDLVGDKAKGVVRDKLGAKHPRLKEVDDRFGVLATTTVEPLGRILARPRYDHTPAAPVVSFNCYASGETPDRAIDIQQPLAQGATFSDRLVLNGSDTSASLHLVGGDIVYHRPAWARGDQWHQFRNELAVVNGSVVCEELVTSVLIADGDVTLHTPWRTASAVVIARGDIRTAADSKALPTSNSLFVAGGKITSKWLLGAPSAAHPVGMLLAGGGLELDEEKRLKKQDPNRQTALVLDGVEPADLGVRWFELGDVGLEVAADLWTVQVKAVADKSPFRGHLKPKDVLLEINTVPVGSTHGVRHALRRAYSLGFAVVTFERAGKVQWKMIPIDDLMDTPPPKKDDKK